VFGGSILIPFVSEPRPRDTVFNVVGVLPNRTRVTSGELIGITAHLDHLGVGTPDATGVAAATTGADGVATDAAVAEAAAEPGAGVEFDIAEVPDNTGAPAAPLGEAGASGFALIFALGGSATSAERAATAVGLVSKAFTNAAMSSARSAGSVRTADKAGLAVAIPPPAAAKIRTSPAAWTPEPTTPVAMPAAPPPTAEPALPVAPTAGAPNPTNIFAPGGLRSRLSRTTRSGCRPLNPTVRTLSCGSSASTVPTPVITAEHRARQRCTSLRALSPVIH